MSNIKYPIEMISTDGDIIVEFTSVNEGTVVGGTFYEVGFHSDNWTPADEPTEWLPVVTNYEEDNKFRHL